MGIMNIGLCDDDVICMEELEYQIRNISAQHANQYTIGGIYQYQTGQELLQNAKKIQIVFLDIDMPQIDGIETGYQLHELNPECSIVMATGQMERINDSFKIQAKRFLKKPFRAAEIEEALLFLLKEKPGASMLTLYQDRKKIEVSQRDVRVMTSIDSYVEFQTNFGICRSDTSIKQLETILDNRIFFTINRSQIVNLNYVKKRDYETYELNGQPLEIARNRKKALHTAYRIFDTNYR